jgi:hypothetical protein
MIVAGRIEVVFVSAGGRRPELGIFRNIRHRLDHVLLSSELQVFRFCML